MSTIKILGSLKGHIEVINNAVMKLKFQTGHIAFAFPKGQLHG